MSLPTKNTFTGFNLQKVWVSPNGGASGVAASWTRIPGILRMAATGGTKVVEQMGDGGLMGNWLWDQRATLELETSVIVPDLITALNGSTASGTASTPIVYFGSDTSSNPPFVRVRGMAVSRQNSTSAAISTAASGFFCRYTFFKCQITNDPMPEAAAAGQLHQYRYQLIAMPALYDDAGLTLAAAAGTNATWAVARADLGLTSLDAD